MNPSGEIVVSGAREHNLKDLHLRLPRDSLIVITGLSGSGKSTLANALEVQLNEQGRHTFVLDGDNVRTGLCSDLGMSDAARKENIRRIGEVARLMLDAGLIVIYISTPIDVCARRDPKGLYRAAQEGRIKAFTGLDSPYEAPVHADCEINTDEVELVDAVEQILATLFKK